MCSPGRVVSQPTTHILYMIRHQLKHNLLKSTRKPEACHVTLEHSTFAMIYFCINNAHGPTRPWLDQSYIACYGPGFSSRATSIGHERRRRDHRRDLGGSRRIGLSLNRASSLELLVLTCRVVGSRANLWGLDVAEHSNCCQFISVGLGWQKRYPSVVSICWNSPRTGTQCSATE